MRKKFLSTSRFATAIADLQNNVPYFTEDGTRYVIINKVEDTLQVAMYQKTDTDTRICTTNTQLIKSFTFPIDKIHTVLFDEKIKTVADFIAAIAE